MVRALVWTVPARVRCASPLGVLVLFCGLALASRTLAATSPSDPDSGHFHFADRPLTLDGVLGFGTPVGFAGAAVQYDLVSAVSLGAGVGVDSGKPAYAALARFRPFIWNRPERALALEIGSAFSASHYEGQLADVAGLAGEGGVTRYTQTYTLDLTYWAQFDIGFEMKSRSGLHIVVAHGFAVPLNAGSGFCTVDGTSHRVPCDSMAIHPGERPSLVPVVLTLMIGWSI